MDFYRRNDAIAENGNTNNGRTAQIAITTAGSDIYFAICAVMGTVSLATIGLSMLKPRTDRIFFYITAALNATACLAYFTMGSNLGWAAIAVEFDRANPKVAGQYREIFYARYVDWVITTPLLLMDLLLTAAMPWPTILWVIFLDEVMIITGLIGALVASRYKFGFYAFGCAAMLGIFYELGINANKHAKALGKDVHRVFMSCGVLTLFIWTLYPIAWGVSEGGNVIPPDSEAIFYGVLDLIAKPVFSIALIYGHWSIKPSRMGLRIREFGEPLERDHHEEKDVNTSGSSQDGAQNGVATDGATTTGATTGHAAHTRGYAPAYEESTTEGPPHTRV